MQGRCTRFRTAVRKYKDYMTLTILVAFILVFPLFETSSIGDLFMVFLVTLFLLSALYSVSDSPRQVAMGVLLAVPTLLTGWTLFFLPSIPVMIALLITLTMFFTYILLVILHRVLLAREVTSVEICRAVMVYIMIGLIFGLIYMLMEILTHGSFIIGHGDITLSGLIYFSFVSLSTAGFGDIYAVAPIARSVVIIETLVGVMYLAVLIGLLINAHYSTRYSQRREDTGERKGTVGLGEEDRGVRFFSSSGPLVLLAVAIMLNLGTSIAMISFGLPIFLDTWGTSLAVILGGFYIGALAGVLYNLIMAFSIWDPITMVWAGSSVLVAGMTWLFWREGWVDVRRPVRLILAGVATGVINGLFAFGIITVLSLQLYVETAGINALMTEFFHNEQAGLLFAELLVEIIDKTLALILAAVVALLLGGLLTSGREKKSGNL
jgi:voltage-gated potassium channel